MEVGIPTWNAGARSYSFQILKSEAAVKATVYFEVGAAAPALPALDAGFSEVLQLLLEKVKQYFTAPLRPEKVLRHLRHTLQEGNLPTATGWYEITWSPFVFVVKAGEFELVWQIRDLKEATPTIPLEFTESQTPRAKSPDVPEQTRTIQIHDALIPVGDLPLSDLPPLPFSMEEADPLRIESKRRIREAKLKVALAKLKAQRMEQKYFERYGQTPEDSEGSSDVSSDSEEEFPFEPHSRG